MARSTTTVSAALALRSAPAGPQDDWRQRLAAKLAEQAKSIQWPAAMPDLVEKLAAAFDVELPALLLPAWRKADEIAKALEESRREPAETTWLELAEHTIVCEHEPCLEVRLFKAVPVARINFKAKLEVTLRGLELEIRDGEVRGIAAGSCEGTGVIALADTPVLTRKLAPLRLDGARFDPEPRKDRG